MAKMKPGADADDEQSQGPDDARLKVADVYAAIAENYRYFLNWRARLLAGYFAVLAALAFAFGWLQSEKHFWVSVAVPFVGAGLTLVFWLLDMRNREAYRAMTRVGFLNVTG